MNEDDLLADLDALVTESWKTRTPCMTGRMLQSMPDHIRVKVEELMGNPDVVTSSLAQVLRRWGYEVSYSSLTRHRRRGVDGTGCACP